MNTCDGRFYDGESARSCAAVLRWNPDSPVLTLQLPETGRELQFERESVHVDAALGAGSPRTIRFEGGARFYASSGDSLDGLYGAGPKKRFNPHDVASRLERHRHAFLISILLLALFVFAGYRYGIPAVADSLAYKLPSNALEAMSDNTLETMDKYFGFHTTRLKEADQLRLRALFDSLVSDMGTEAYRYRLEFRSFGINAFALPSGLIVVGDELVEAMPDDAAILAVFAHELAHVEHRHATRQLLREAGVAFLLGSAFGDLSSGAGVFAALPRLILSSGYSRGFETDADLFAADYMLEYQGNPTAMIDALETLAGSTKGHESQTLGWISSHPLTLDRIETIRQHQER